MSRILKNTKIYTSILLAVLALAVACKKEKPLLDISDKDPCSCAEEVSAEFTIEERATHIPEEIWDETDTTNWDSMVRFTATEDDAQYTWYIGSQVFNTRSVSRFFSDEWKENDIPITLVVKKQPNNTCLPEDDGYDSITKTFHVSKYPIIDIPNHEIYHPIEGTYRVFGSSVDDSIEVTLNIRNTSLNVPTYDIVNPDGSGIVCYHEASLNPNIAYFSYRRIKFGKWNPDGIYGLDFCSGLGGEIFRNDKNQVFLKLSTKYNIFDPIQYNWELHGIKVN